MHRRCFGASGARLSRRDPALLRGGTFMRICPQIFRCELVISFEAILQVGKQFLCAQAGSFLNSDRMSAEQRKVNRHDELAWSVASCHQIEPVPARIRQLLKSEVAKFHSFLLPLRHRPNP